MPALLLFAGMLLATPAAAGGEQIYKWVDASGNVTFSSTPPPGTTAQAVELPATPPPAEIEAARERERSLQELGDQLSQDRLVREAQAAEERRAARAEAGPQPPVQRVQESGIATDGDWWIPPYAVVRPPPYLPLVPGRPVRPLPGRDPTAPPDHPAYWPREPVLPPDDRPLPPPSPAPRPGRR